MTDKVKLEELLDKIHIPIYYYNEDYEVEIRSFEDVMGDLAESWDALSNDYKDELYAAMGVMPNK